MELDYPMQKHLTDVHKDMNNINEQFLFDIINGSEELTFSIFDRVKDYGSKIIVCVILIGCKLAKRTYFSHFYVKFHEI